MGKVYIGVTAVGGHKLLWVVGGKRVAGLGVLGEWVSGGRLTAGGGEVAGRACTAPTGGELKIVGRPALRPPRACAGVGTISGHLCRGAASSTPRGGVKTPPYDVGVRRGV